MAQHVVPSVSENDDDGPNHLIFWLDKHIGQPEECILLKSSFFLAMDPTSGLYERSLSKDDIDVSIRSEGGFLIRLDQVEFVLQAFDNADKCFEAFEKNRHKRIFLITSGSKGRLLIPGLVINFPKNFTEGYWMYVFCANMNMISVEDVGPPTNDWALNFLEHILMYDHQDDLLARLILDIANYFSEKAKSLASGQQLSSARQYYGWSKKMYYRYETMVSKDMTAKCTEIDEHITNIEQRLIHRSISDDDLVSQQCD